MGAQILVHFSKETLTNFPQIVEGYRGQFSPAKATREDLEAVNLLESVEETAPALEEDSSIGT